MDRKDELTALVVQKVGLKDRRGDAKLTPEIVQKMREGWELGLATQKSLCSFVGIAPQTYNRYMTEFPEMEELRALCQEKLNIEARKNIQGAIKRGHLETSRWYLEKTDSQFQKQDNNVVNVAVISVTDREKELNKFMERFTDAGVVESVESKE